MLTPTTSRILVVEDRQGEREAMARVLRLEGYTVLAASSIERALEFLNEPVQLVISDLRLGKQSAIDLLRQWKQAKPDTPVLLMTAYGDVDSAVTAMKLGAEDFLTKPVDPTQLLALVQSCLQKFRLSRLAPSPLGEWSGKPGFDRIVGRSRILAEICDQIWRVAQTDNAVLIQGEAGTGKELVAEVIHQNSSRAAAPFVPVRLAGVPEASVESELFGQGGGTSKPASTSRAGRFESAHNGTAFIDEVGNFPPALQAKLYRLIESRTVTPAGSLEQRPVEVRVVAATGRNLHSLMLAGQFREDLYHRLNVVTIYLPPLRERREDIQPLVQHFLSEFAARTGQPPLTVSPELLQLLETLDWAGNVRQLHHCLERMAIVARSQTLTPADLPSELNPKAHELEAAFVEPPGSTMDSLKRAAILRALEHFQGNRTRAAESLGISVRTLQRKLKEWNLGETAETNPSPTRN